MFTPPPPPPPPPPPVPLEGALIANGVTTPPNLSVLNFLDLISHLATPSRPHLPLVSQRPLPR
ncbi:hypothetical protein [Vibrio diabolicus]|uniref:hypothetical protein n=1 Tax=Vibrio diabolicus TaxID=50719 RepID=UPI00211B2EB4|nr:hypothetical protein [Vibrio diabolicus]MCG6223570.1 hypothetical protein [Vibrio diabolicus]